MTLPKTKPKDIQVAEDFYEYIATNKETGENVSSILDRIMQLSDLELRCMLAYFAGYAGMAIRSHEERWK